MDVYWGSGSQFSWRVLLALELKRVPYRSKLLQFSQREHKSPDYLKLNPRGRVPTIVDGDTVVYESLAILAYLDRKHPDPPIFGRTAEEAGRVMQAVSEHAAYMETDVEALVLPLYFGQAAQKAEEVKTAATSLRRELAAFDRAATRTPFLAGDAISAADLVVFPSVKSIERAASKEAAKPLDLGLVPLAEHFGALSAWTKRISAIPGYERTYPPHWK